MTIPLVFALLSGITVIVMCIFYVISLNKRLKHSTAKYNELLFDIAKKDERLRFLLDVETRYHELQSTYNAVCIRVSELETELKLEKESVAEKLAIMQQAGDILSDRFAALSADALSKNNQSFLDLAKASFESLQVSARNQIETGTKEFQEISAPIKRALSDVDAKLQVLENNRISMTQSITEQISAMITSQDKLKKETNKLSAALKSPNIRGKWGEMQLRRVVEIAGMMKHCDFDEQVSNINANIRPDMVIHLPGERTIIVDAKTPLSAYMSALESDNDEDCTRLLKNHAKQVRNHCIGLSHKEYNQKIPNSPDFVVMFLPGDIFFSTALEHDPSLIEYAIEHNVVISTPTTLLALLHAIAAGWRNAALSDNAKRIVEMGKGLHKTLKHLEECVEQIGVNIDTISGSYGKLSSLIRNEVKQISVDFANLDVQARETH